MTTDRPVFSVCSGVLAASFRFGPVAAGASLVFLRLGDVFMAKGGFVNRYARRLIGAVVAVVMAGAVCTPVAMADDADLSSGYWYVDDMGVRDAWKQDITGKGVKVAVVDGQAVSNYPALADADITFKAAIEGGSSCKAKDDFLSTGRLGGSRTMSADDSGRKAGDGGIYMSHGTAMASFIVGNGRGYDGTPGILGSAPDATVLFYAQSFPSPGLMSEAIGIPCVNDKDSPLSISHTFRQATDDGARLISLSMSGPSTGLDVPDWMYALRHGVIVVSGRGNFSTDANALDLVGEPLTINKFPGFIVTNTVDSSGNIFEDTNVVDGDVSVLSPSVNVVLYRLTEDKKAEIGAGGTSAATAILSGYLALALQKWPKATGNQILQSLIRNTKGNESGEPRLDPEHKRGFGEVDVARLLSVDPTQYPDINPLLAWAYETSEKHDETRGMYTDHSDWGKNADYAPTDPFTTDGSSIMVPREADLVGQEYERQQAAWKKVEQCKSDGGSDCMRYSATATADETEGKSDGKSDGRIVLPGTGDGKDVVKSSGVPVWVWLAAGGVGIAVVAGGIVLAVVLSKRGKQGRRPLPDAAAAGPSPYAGPRQPVPGMAYPNRPYSPQYGGPGSRPVPQYQAPGPAQVPSQYRRNVGPVSPRYAQPQQQANPVPQNPVPPAQPYPQPPASQVPNVAGGYGQEQGYSPQQYPPQSGLSR